MPFNIGAPELIILLIIALVVIGPGRLPDVGAALGKSIREFRKASTDISDAARIDTSPLPPSAAPTPTPQPPTATQTASTVPAPIVTPPTPPSDDETVNHPA
ncbi:MAG: twin-arginine translocase TatA/TatE family subunit [Chloroflexi bacterium]|nr:twin-arginine translocase TatA/TatE family subunit [Chloroflexota bacterium]